MKMEVGNTSLVFFMISDHNTAGCLYSVVVLLVYTLKRYIGKCKKMDTKMDCLFEILLSLYDLSFFT